MKDKLLDLIEDYLFTLKDIENTIDDNGGLTMYTFEVSRQELHNEIVDEFMTWLPEGIDRNIVYTRSKEIFSNLDKVCKLYSTAEEWKSDDYFDVMDMAKYVRNYLTLSVVRQYISGRIDINPLLKS